MDDTVSIQAEAEHAPTTDRRSARSPRIEVITRGERRRAWALGQKREIVLESLQPDVRPADVARRYGINTGLLYTWRRQMLEGQLGDPPRRLPSFARVVVEAAHDPGPMSREAGDPDCGPMATPCTAAASSRGGVIEIVLPTGVSIRVDAHVDGPALRQVLAALAER